MASRRVEELARQPGYDHHYRHRIDVAKEFGWSLNQLGESLRGTRWLTRQDYVRLARHPTVGHGLVAILMGVGLLHKSPSNSRFSESRQIARLLRDCMLVLERKRDSMDVKTKEQNLERLGESLRGLLAVASDLQRTVARLGGDPGTEPWEELQRQLGATPKEAEAKSVRDLVRSLVTDEPVAVRDIRRQLEERGMTFTSTQVSQAVSGLRRRREIETTGVRGQWRRTQAKGNDQRT